MYMKFWFGILKDRDRSEDTTIDMKVILTWIVRKMFWRIWTGFT